MRAETGGPGLGGKHKQKTYKIKFASLKILIKLANPLAKLVNKGEGTNYQQQE